MGTAMPGVPALEASCLPVAQTPPVISGHFHLSSWSLCAALVLLSPGQREGGRPDWLAMCRQLVPSGVRSVLGDLPQAPLMPQAFLGEEESVKLSCWC